ncbi:unnamed protein product, partial [Effrenium voratum]
DNWEEYEGFMEGDWDSYMWELLQKEMHYDAILYLEEDDACPVREVEPEASEEERPMKKPAGNKRNQGYDMSNRRPPPNHMEKTRFALREDEMPEGLRENFFKTITSSLASGGKRKRVCGEATAEMHWYGFRAWLDLWIRYIGWLKKHDLLTDALKVDAALALKEKKCLKAYFLHLEEDDTVRKKPYTPGAIRLVTRNLVACQQVLLVGKLGRKKDEAAKMQKWNDIVRAFGKTSEEARAIAGPGLPAPRKDGQDTEDEEDPLTAPQIMGMAEAFLDKIRKLKKRIANLPDDTDEAAKNYMKYRLATYKAAYLAAVAIMETCERIGTVLHRTLRWSRKNDTFEFVPAGVAPTKTEKAKRMSKGYFVAKKLLSKEWTRMFLQFMETDQPHLVRVHGQGSIKPEVRKGSGEKVIWRMLPYDKFRKLVKMVGKAPSTDIRTAAEAMLTSNPALLSTLQNQRTLQKFLGHDAGTSLKHYHLADSRLISQQLHAVTRRGKDEEEEEDEKDKGAKKARKGKK